MAMIDVDDLMTKFVNSPTTRVADFQAVVNGIKNFTNIIKWAKNEESDQLKLVFYNNFQQLCTTLSPELKKNTPIAKGTAPYPDLENSLKYLNILSIQKDIYDSFGGPAAGSMSVPQSGLISIEFEFTNPAVSGLQIKDSSTFSAILSEIYNQANAANLNPQKREKAAKGGVCDLIEVDYPYKGNTYKIQYDLDQACVECRLVKIPIGLWYTNRSDIQHVLDMAMYQVCMHKELLKSVFKDTKKDNFKWNYTMAVTPTQLITIVDQDEPPTSKLTDGDKKKIVWEPLQCHVNICNTIFGNPFQLIGAYAFVMSATEAQGSPARDSVKINSGRLEDRITSSKSSTFTLPTPDPAPTALNPPAPTVAKASAPTLNECFEAVQNSLINSIIIGQNAAILTLPIGLADIGMWLMGLGEEMRMGTDLAKDPSAQAVDKNSKRYHYLAFNVQHCVNDAETPHPYIECRRPLMPEEADGVLPVIDNVLKDIYIPNFPQTMTLNEALNRVTDLAKPAGVTLVPNWKQF